jgi:hypothetical protein
MASIHETPYGTWEVHYRNPFHRQRTKTFKRKVDARRFSTEVDADVRRGNWTAPEQARQTFSEVAEEWFSWPRALPALGPRSIGTIDRALSRQFTRTWGRRAWRLHRSERSLP